MEIDDQPDHDGRQPDKAGDEYCRRAYGQRQADYLYEIGIPRHNEVERERECLSEILHDRGAKVSCRFGRSRSEILAA